MERGSVTAHSGPRWRLLRNSATAGRPCSDKAKCAICTAEMSFVRTSLGTCRELQILRVGRHAPTPPHSTGAGGPSLRRGRSRCRRAWSRRISRAPKLESESLAQLIRRYAGQAEQGGGPKCTQGRACLTHAAAGRGFLESLGRAEARPHQPETRHEEDRRPPPPAWPPARPTGYAVTSTFGIPSRKKLSWLKQCQSRRHNVTVLRGANELSVVPIARS